MARYRGPKTKLCRRLGFQVVRNSGVAKAYARREQLNTNRRFRKPSEYGQRLLEKQKLRFYYEVSEKQLRKLYVEATRIGGNVGHNLLILLERRLDNVVCNMRFGTTMSDARQLVTHGHITVNGKKVKSPAYHVQEGDVIGVRDSEKSKKRVQNALAQVGDYLVPEWVGVNDEELSGRILRLPSRDDVRCPVDEQKIVEFYSR